MAYDQKTKISPRKKMAMNPAKAKTGKIDLALNKGGTMKYKKGGMKKGC